MPTTPSNRTTLLARRLRVDIDTGTYPASNYVELIGKREVNPLSETRAQDDEGYEEDGAAREATTGYNWRLELKISNSVGADGSSLDVVHGFLRQKYLAAQTINVAAGEFGVRWYDKGGRSTGEEFEGRCYVKQWQRDSSSTADLEIVTVVLQGQGPRTAITNPNSVNTPAVTGVSPVSGPAAGGNLVTIFGSKLTTATAVKFGATAAPVFTVVNDTTIVAEAPAGSAGLSNVYVTTTGGTSTDNGVADNYTYTA